MTVEATCLSPVLESDCNLKSKSWATNVQMYLSFRQEYSSAECLRKGTIGLEMSSERYIQSGTFVTATVTVGY